MNQGLDIITEVELSYYISEAPIIGITGTNGKTTVTSLIGDMFGNSKVNGQVSGNIGVVASKVAQEVTKDDYLITELSSFQLLEQSIIVRISRLLQIFILHIWIITVV